MNAGELDRRVILRRAVPSEGPLSDGVDWVSFGSSAPDGAVWAKHTPVLDDERARALAATSVSVTDRFLIRWTPDVAGLGAEHQLTFDGWAYDIRAVKPVGRREGLEITASRAGEART